MQRRDSGSHVVGSVSSACAPSAAALRMSEPRFSASFTPSVTTTWRARAMTSSTTSGRARRATATMPRCKSNPTTAVMTSGDAEYTVTGLPASRSSARSVRPVDVSTAMGS
ncbi:MAG: hypothetical protein V9E99_16345 [Microthrixaceae bacterium]